MKKALSVDDLARQLLECGNQEIEIGGGVVLTAVWRDHDNVLCGVVRKAGAEIPLLDQRISTIVNGEWSSLQTRDMACAALAEQAIELAGVAC